MPQVELIDNASDGDIALWLHARLVRALGATEGDVAICVPGGTTPLPILGELRSMPLEWRRIVVWPGDERMVPESHSASNAGRIRALLQPAGARIVNLAEADLAPHFALTWLGMGTDGHIASLFPSSDPQADDPHMIRRLVPDPLPADAPYERMSLTIPALVDSDQLVLVTRGAEKHKLVEAAVRGANDLPVARLLRAAHQPVVCFT